MDCQADLLICIDWVAVAIGGILKDGVTMTCLAIMLIVLMRVRNRQKKQRDATYASQLKSSSDRLFESSGRTWVVQNKEPQSQLDHD